MKLSVVAVSVVVICILIAGCATQYGQLTKSAQQSYAAMHYDDAIKNCAAALKLNPGYAAAQTLIQDAYRATIIQHESNVAEGKASASKFKWDEVVQNYEALMEVTLIVRSLPTLTDAKTKVPITFEIKDYTSQSAEARSNAAEAHYSEGIRLSADTNIDIQKKAAKEFKSAMTFVPEYKNSSELYDNCRKAGIKRIAVVPFEDKSGKPGKYGALSETIVDDIITKVMGDPDATEFLEIISRDQLDKVLREQKRSMSGEFDQNNSTELGKLLNVHEIVTGKITQIIFNPAQTVNHNQQDKQSVVVGEEPYTDKNGKSKTRSVWGDVFANVTIYSKTSSAKITGSFQIIDIQTGKVLTSESFIGNKEFAAEWGRYQGDERALSRQSKSLCSQSETPAPVEEEMVSGAGKNLSSLLADKFIAHVK